MFFAGLFAAYFTLRAATDPWPPSGVDLATGRTAIATAVLVLSSLTMHVAVKAAEEGNRGRAIRWLAITAALGVLFLSNQLVEYVQADFRISSHAYGSAFYLMTGFHGLHVIGGLCFMLGVAGAIAGRTSRVPPASTVAVCGYYWHFVDVVWVVMFATIYLLK
jgi:cytochrome c oxidase subunit 3